MASYTTNLNLKKPAGSEAVAIGDINNNMDTIDQAYGTLSNQIANKIGHFDVSLTDVAVTSSDQGGYYGEKDIDSLVPTGATPFSVATYGGYAGGAAYNIGFVGGGWKIIIASSKSFTFGSGRSATVYYYR